MNRRIKILITMFAAAGFLAWLSTPSDPGPRVRFDGGFDAAKAQLPPQMARAKLRSSIVCQPCSMLNIVSFDEVIAHQPAKTENVGVGSKSPAE